MGTLTFDYVRGFTATGGRSLEVWVNGGQIGTSITVSPTSNTVVTYSSVLNISGSVQLEIRSTGSSQVIVDNIQWTSYTAALNPEIDITGNGTSIANNDLIPSAADHTDFGSTPVAGGTVTRTFTIQNTGSGPLTLSAASPYVSISGANAADFTVTAIPSTPVAASGSTTFQVSFDPSAAGTRTASISIASDDPDEDPYVFAIQGTGSVPAPEINLTGNSVSIVHNDLSPSTLDDTDFGPALVLSGSVTHTFTIQNQGLATLNLTGVSPYVTISGANAADFSLTAIPSTPIAASGSTTFQVTFAPSAPGLRTATLSIASDDADEDPYVFAIQGTGANSAFSDIIADAAFSYNSDIDYTQYQAATITNTSSSVGVFRFTIRDGGAAASDADTYGTTLNAITFNVSNIANLRSAALFDGNAMLANNPVIAGSSISFSGLSGSSFTAPDNGSQDLTLRVSFLTTVTDNQQLQFTVSSASASASGSTFALANAGGAASSTSGNRNRIEVTADRLAFVQQPSTTSENVSMSPAVTLSATDVNGNRDLDYVSAVSITSTGTMTGTPLSASAASGLASFGSIVHTVSGTGFTLQATAPGLLPATSTTFDINTVPANSYRTTSNGTWPSSGTATWERFVAGVWTASAAPAANTTSNLYIRHTVTSNAAFAAGAPGTTMIIENNGNFTGAHNCTYASLTVKSGGTMQVNNPGVTVSSSGVIRAESGALVVLNSTTLDNGDGLWDGTEDFQAGSTVELRNWDWDAGSSANRLIRNPSQISANSDGYLFGNFYFNANPGENFNFVQSIPFSGTFLPLTKNDLIIRNASASSAVQLVNTDQDVEIGGTLRVEAGEFRFAAVSVVEVAHTVKGNIVMNAGTINLNPTSGSSNGCVVNLEGDLILSGGTITMADLTATGLKFSGTVLQNIDVKNTVAMSGLKMEVLSGASVQLINQDLRLGNNSDLTVRSGGVFSFNFSAANTPLNITEISAANTTAFAVESGGTIKITSDHNGGALRSGAALSGNVQTDARTFNAGAIYHFIGKSAQVPGNGMPSPVSGRVITELDNASLTLSLEMSRQISGTLQMIQGDIVTGSYLLELGISSAQTGTLNYTDGYVAGTMKRWFNGTNSGAASGLFPFGVGGYDRFVTVEYTAAPTTGGSLTGHFEPVPMGLSGLPLNIAVAGSCAAFSAENTQTEGYWQMDANDGLNGGSYDITLVGENFSGITSLCELTALKRTGGGPWQESGAHQQPQGTLSRPVLQRTGASGWSNWGFSGGIPNPLPVSMGDMEVICGQDGKARLVWSTYSEVNNAYFEIEEGRTPYAFEKAGTVSGAGNSNELNSYSFELPQADMHYVRLRQVDFNGTETLYGPLGIHCGKASFNWQPVWNGAVLQITFDGAAYGLYTSRI
ncbi:MAG: choice-of-anchor D domain-containing protein, partial [Bacteroidia bacterium]|nr:choice-of-anchor D domain-containing protein [Bacteroidia bacterium]